MDLEVLDRIAVVTFRSGENWLNESFVSSLSHILDRVEAQRERVSVLVTMTATKHYCNGVQYKTASKEDLASIVNGPFPRLISRLALFPIATVACINGHAYGAGAMLAFAHDYRIMFHRGFLCVPAAKLGIDLPHLVVKLVRTKFSAQAARDLIIGGVKLTGSEAFARGIVDVDADAQEPRKVALEFASKQLDSVGPSFAQLKAKLWSELNGEQKQSQSKSASAAKISGIAHVMLTVSSFDRAKVYYSKLLSFLGLHQMIDSDDTLYYVGGRTAFGIRCGKPNDQFVQERVGLHHVCFRMKSKDEVDELYRYIQSNLPESKIIHPPQLDDFVPGYYSILWEDIDGIRLEANFVPGKGFLASKL